MSTMHDQITDRLSEYLDDELTPAERAGVDAHLAGCADCRGVLEDLRRIVTAAQQLPGSIPDRELWEGVEGRLTARTRGVELHARARVARIEARPRRRFSFTLPQLAAAGIVLMLFSGGMVYMLQQQAPPVDARVTGSEPAVDGGIVPISLVDAQYEGAVADLERMLGEGRGRLDPNTVRVLEQNLASIDAAIDQCRRALEADPANTFLTSHLVETRQRKLALLRRATALTTGS